LAVLAQWWIPVTEELQRMAAGWAFALPDKSFVESAPDCRLVAILKMTDGRARYLRLRGTRRSVPLPGLPVRLWVRVVFKIPLSAWFTASLLGNA
jgi:hypothetical protein